MRENFKVIQQTRPGGEGEQRQHQGRGIASPAELPGKGTPRDIYPMALGLCLFCV